MQRINTQLDRRLGNGRRHQDYRAERVHDHAYNCEHHDDHQHGDPGTGQVLREERVNNIRAFQDTAEADRKPNKRKQSSDVHR